MTYLCLDREAYRDKIHGCWIGKCLGGAAGAPWEGVKEIVDASAWPTRIDPALPNDDLDLQLLWLDTVERVGPDLRVDDLAAAWMDRCWYPFSEYGYFLKNARRGIPAPYSGRLNNEFFSDGMGCPIRSEIWACLFPGRPALAGAFAAADASLDHDGAALDGEVFLAAVESAAFVAADLEAALRAGLETIKDSRRGGGRIAALVEFALAARRRGDGPMPVRSEILARFGHRDFSNCVQNIGFVLLAVLWGDGDMRRTIDLAVSCGYDTDCTAASAAALLGISRGAGRIEPELARLASDTYTCGIDVHRPDQTIARLAADTCALGYALAGAEASGRWRRPYDRILAHAESLGFACPSGIPSAIDPGQDATGARFAWSADDRPIDATIEYPDGPVCGIRGDGTGRCRAVLRNRTDRRVLARISAAGGWTSSPAAPDAAVAVLRDSVLLEAGASAGVDVECRFVGGLAPQGAGGTVRVAADQDSNGAGSEAFLRVGFSGAAPWSYWGPYRRPMNRPIDPRYPSPHGEGAVLPDIVCMVNDEVSLSEEYRDETRFDFLDEVPDGLAPSGEDRVPLDEAIGLNGQWCAYAALDVYASEDRRCWAIVGNTDAYRLWINGALIQERDEARMWTPVNNFELVDLRRGKNTVVLKLLRRTERFAFSLGFRSYAEGVHWHRSEWLTDLAFGSPGKQGEPRRNA